MERTFTENCLQVYIHQENMHGTTIRCCLTCFCKGTHWHVPSVLVCTSVYIHILYILYIYNIHVIPWSARQVLPTHFVHFPMADEHNPEQADRASSGAAATPSTSPTWKFWMGPIRIIMDVMNQDIQDDSSMLAFLAPCFQSSGACDSCDSCSEIR